MCHLVCACTGVPRKEFEWLFTGTAQTPDRELGAAYDAAMQEMIFDPLGMHDTTFSIDKALAADHASPHGEDVDGKLHVLKMDINRAIAPFRPASGAWSSPHE